MGSRSYSTGSAVPRWATPRRPERKTLGHQVIAIAKELGKPFMPWQAQNVLVALELLEDGSLAYREVITTVPRQSGKTQKNLAVELHRALMWRTVPQRIYYSAQTGQDARKKLLDDQVPMIQSSPMKFAVRRVYEAAGHEGIRFHNGSRIDTTASGDAAGHGPSIDLAIIDEAFADVDNRREQAMNPAMVTHIDAQRYVDSTAGHEGSVYLRRKVDLGRDAVASGMDTGIAYFEYSAPEDADIEDPRVWRACMPALGFTVDEKVIRQEFHSMTAGVNADEPGFRRAFLNQWTVTEDRVIPAALWNRISKPEVKPETGLTFGIEISADRAHTSIVAIDNKRRAELVEYLEGPAEAANRTAELANKWIAPVAIDMNGPAASIADALILRGVNLVQYKTSEMAIATSRIYDAIGEETFEFRSHPTMDLAVAGARKRILVDRWLWSRRDAAVDISPLIALTLAFDCSVNIARQGGTLWAGWG